jgi:Flp pilus assembly pilin Flp
MMIKGMKTFKNQRGQTSVEYVLMIAAIVAVMASVFGIIKDRFVGDANCPTPDTSMMCRLNSLWRSDDPSVFKYFPL